MCVAFGTSTRGKYSYPCVSRNGPWEVVGSPDGCRDNRGAAGGGFSGTFGARGRGTGLRGMRENEGGWKGLKELAKNRKERKKKKREGKKNPERIEMERERKSRDHRPLCR